MFWMVIAERGFYALYLVGLLISVASVMLTLLSGNIAFFGAWTFLGGACLAYYSFKKRSLLEALKSLLRRSFLTYAAVGGFLMRPTPPEEYPLDPEIVQECHHE
jgi:hypothetical protein